MSTPQEIFDHKSACGMKALDDFLASNESVRKAIDDKVDQLVRKRNQTQDQKVWEAARRDLREEMNSSRYRAMVDVCRQAKAMILKYRKRLETRRRILGTADRSRLLATDQQALSLLSENNEVGQIYKELAIEALASYKKEIKEQFQRLLNKIESEYRALGTNSDKYPEKTATFDALFHHSREFDSRIPDVTTSLSSPVLRDDCLRELDNEMEELETDLSLMKEATESAGDAKLRDTTPIEEVREDFDDYEQPSNPEARHPYQDLTIKEILSLAQDQRGGQNRAGKPISTARPRFRDQDRSLVPLTEPSPSAEPKFELDMTFENKKRPAEEYELSEDNRAHKKQRLQASTKKASEKAVRKQTKNAKATLKHGIKSEKLKTRIHNLQQQQAQMSQLYRRSPESGLGRVAVDLSGQELAERHLMDLEKLKLAEEVERLRTKLEALTNEAMKLSEVPATKDRQYGTRMRKSDRLEASHQKPAHSASRDGMLPIGADTGSELTTSF